MVSRRRPCRQCPACLLLSLSQQIPDTAAQTPRNALPISLRLAFLDQQGKIVPTKLAADAPAQDEHVILLTEEHLEQSIYAPQVANLTPSILRNFSAPVVVDDDLSPDERRHIMRYDSDLFNRWDSAQTLVSDEILAISADPQGALNTDRIAGSGGGCCRGAVGLLAVNSSWHPSVVGRIERT